MLSNAIVPRLSVSTSPGLSLVHKDTGKVLETLPILPAQETHRNFILATWVKSYAPTARRLLSQAVYAEGETRLAESLWQKSHVLTSKDDDYTIHAWVCGEPGKLYHCYVVPALRHRGVAKALIELACGTTLRFAKPSPLATHRPGWTLDPYILVNR
jgi:GNAT superfamily N-acetyltransferase